MFNTKMFRLVMLVVFVMVIVSSAMLPAVEAEHDCTGEDCPVCWCLNVCKNTLKNSAIPFAGAYVCALVIGAVFMVSGVQWKIALRSDLVALSVKLSR